MNRITDYSKLKSDISDWMADYMKSSGMNCFIVGVSGGIDSAVVSTLAAETRYNVFARYANTSRSKTRIIVRCTSQMVI